MHSYRNLNNIRAISFDLDDTLYDNHPVIHRVESEMVKWLHLNHPISATISLEKWQQFKQDILIENPCLKHDVTLWRMQQIEFGLMKLGYTSSQANKAAKKGIEHALWLRNQVEVPQETYTIMSLLAEKYPLVAITNGNVDVNAIGLGHYFKFVLKSGPDGRSKPYPDMFEQAVKRLAMPAGEILHVGDHPISDVQGAINAGLQTCWLNSNKTSTTPKQKLKSLPSVEINHLHELTFLL